MPKLKNDGYPKNVRFENGQFYYRKGKQKRIALGRTPKEMWENYEQMFGADGASRKLITDALNEYTKKEIEYSSESWKKEQYKVREDVRATFGHMVPIDISVGMVQRYLDLIQEKRGLATARKHKSFLRHFFTCMQRWDYLPHTSTNAAKLTELDPLPPRTYAPSEADFWAFFRLARPTIKVAILLCRGTAMREADILKKMLTDVSEDGIKNIQGKRKRDAKERKQLFAHNAYTNLAVSLGRELSKERHSLYLIPTKDGTPHTTDGFRSVWRIDMLKALDAGVIEQRFSFHDIRRMVGSEQADRYATAALLGNTPAVADRHYRVGYDRIENKAAPSEIPDDIWRTYVCV